MFDVQLFQDIPQVEVGGAIDDYAHGPFFGMFADVGHRARKVRVMQAGHGDEKVVCQVGADHGPLF